MRIWKLILLAILLSVQTSCAEYTPKKVDYGHDTTSSPLGVIDYKLQGTPGLYQNE